MSKFRKGDRVQTDDADTGTIVEVYVNSMDEDMVDYEVATDDGNMDRYSEDVLEVLPPSPEEMRRVVNKVMYFLFHAPAGVAFQAAYNSEMEDTGHYFEEKTKKMRENFPKFWQYLDIENQRHFVVTAVEWSNRNFQI